MVQNFCNNVCFSFFLLLFVKLLIYVVTRCIFVSLWKKVLFEALKQTDKPTKIDDYQIRYPTLVDDVGAVCRFIAEKRIADKSMTGTWHWSGTESMTKYSMVCQMADMFDLPYGHVISNPNPPTGTPRPHNTALSCTELESMMKDGGASMRTPFKQGIKQSLQSFIWHFHLRCIVYHV